MIIRNVPELDYDVNTVLLPHNQVHLIGYGVRTIRVTRKGLKATDTDKLLFKVVLNRSLFADLHMEDDDWFNRTQLPEIVRAITDKEAKRGMA